MSDIQASEDATSAENPRSRVSGPPDPVDHNPIRASVDADLGEKPKLKIAHADPGEPGDKGPGDAGKPGDKGGPGDAGNVAGAENAAGSDQAIGLGNAAGAENAVGSERLAGSENAAEAEQAAGADKPPRTPLAALLSLVREVVVVMLIALGLSWLIKTFLLQAFFIPSPSMESTLIRGDRVLVTKLTPGPFELKRGDVVVFEDPGDWLSATIRPPEGPLRDGLRAGLEVVGLIPAASDEHLIKRLIGLPGDTVICCDDNDRLTVNGVAISEPYLYQGDLPSEMEFSVTVPAGSLWMMGDRRSVSQDSRFHQEEPDGGMVPISKVVGRAFITVWPVDRAGLMRNPAGTFAQVPAP